MLKKFLLLYQLMNRADRKKLAFILCISITNGVFSVVGIASILPFISLLSEPSLIDSHPQILWFRSITGIDSYTGLVVTFAVGSLLLIVVANLIAALDHWSSTRFGFGKELVLSERMMRNYLALDDIHFSQRPDAERAKTILVDIERVLLDTLFAMLEMASGIIVAMFIFALLLMVDFNATLLITLAIVSVYWGVYVFTGKRLDALGRDFSHQQSRLYGKVLETLQLRNEIRLAQKQDYFLEQYRKDFSKIVANRLNYEFISLIPQRVIEVVAFASILAIALFFSLKAQSDLGVISLISVYAFAAYRLMPAVSAVFDSFEHIQFGSAILQQLSDDLQQQPPIHRSGALTLKTGDQLVIRQLEFAFPQTPVPTLQKINLELTLGKFYGIHGRTGCGKSTLLNILAGLYQPQRGTITLNGSSLELFHNLDWQKQLAYLPSTVQTLAASLRHNILLDDDRHLDEVRLQQALQWSCFDSDLVNFAEGLNSRMGELGFSLSTGQRQKLGLARAFYRQPQILLLDESTDALDLASEQNILRNIRQHFNGTVLFVSHRPSVWEFADQLIDLEALQVMAR